MKIEFTEALETLYLIILLWASILSVQQNLWVGIPAVSIVLACVYTHIRKLRRKYKAWKDWTSKLN